MGSPTAKTEAPKAVSSVPGDAATVRRISVRMRPALPRDAAILANLRRQADQIHARLLPDYFQMPSIPEATVTPRSGPEAVTLVAEAGEGYEAEGRGERGGRGQGHAGPIVLGYVSVRLVDTPANPTMTPRRRAHVEAIVVEEGHRGRGIGTALMRAAATWAERRDAAELVLTVWSDNRAAEALYRRLGYQPIARILRREID